MVENVKPYFEILDSPRSVKCNICNRNVMPGERRITANLGTGKFSGHYHLDCFIDKFEDELQELFCDNSDVFEVQSYQL